MSDAPLDSGERRLARRMLDIAARAALRGFGRVEPNPMVGCVLANPSGEVVAVGHHRRFGGAHAEVEALRSCRARGIDPRGMTAFVTLEPCNHEGKTPPCTGAILDAGVARVVCAQRDPHPLSQGGAEFLRASGVPVVFTDVSRLAMEVAEPFLHRVRTGRPWVIAKWAQTMDGSIATRTGHSQWISGAESRRWVHRLRGCVDAVITGIGTVQVDDPLLTARGVPVRRVAQRVVIDPGARMAQTSRLVGSVDDGPVVLVHGAATEARARAEALRRSGVATVESTTDEIDLRWLLEWLAREHSVATVLVEAGAGVFGRLAREDLIDEAWVFTGPVLLGDEQAMGPVRGMEMPRISDGRRFRLLRVKRVGDDVWSVYRRAPG